jgi:hypothetical protein
MVAKNAKELVERLLPIIMHDLENRADSREQMAALIQSSFEEWRKEAEQTASDIPGYWWCPECEEEVASTRVTNQECHDTCGRHVVWKEPIASHQSASEPSAEKALRDALDEAKRTANGYAKRLVALGFGDVVWYTVDFPTLAHEAPKDGSAKTVPMGLLMDLAYMAEKGVMESARSFCVRMAEAHGCTVTESGKEEG